MNYTEQQLTASVVSGKLRPALAGLGSGASASILSLIQRCWDDNPQNRPFTDILLELDPILESRKKSLGKDFSFDKYSISHGDQPADSAKNLTTYQEIINWSTQGEILSKAPPVVDSSLRIWLSCSSVGLVYHPNLSWGSFATCGKRETMEDTHFLMPHMCKEKDIHAFGIFDGHRGMFTFN